MLVITFDTDNLNWSKINSLLTILLLYLWINSNCINQPLNQILGLVRHLTGNRWPRDFSVKNVVEDYLSSQEDGETLGE